MREVLSIWGVARAEQKGVSGALKHKTLGGCLFGIKGRAYPAGDKVERFIGLVVWYMVGLTHIPYQYTLAAGGHACFMLQFKRPLYILLDSLWGVVHGQVARADRWAVVAEELLMVVASLPAMFIDFRQEISTTVMCTDASEEGAGVCVSRALRPGGMEMLLQQLSALPGLFEGLVILHESYAGIGGARRAFEILGCVPVLYFASELKQSAVRVLQVQWPDVILVGDALEITAETFRAHGSKAPEARLVVHTAGSPCPGL